MTAPRRIGRTTVATYGLALALGIVAAVYFGSAGFVLGAALLLLARVGLWASPLIGLSYRAETRGTDAKP